MTNVKFELMKQLSEVEKLISEVEKSLRSYKNLENGKLRMSKSNGCTQYLMIKPGTDKKEYIHSYEKEKIHLLAQREYEEKFHKTLMSTKKRLNRRTAIRMLTQILAGRRSFGLTVSCEYAYIITGNPP